MDDVPTSGESRWKISKREVLGRNPWYEYRRDVGVTDFGKPYEYYYVYKKHSAGIVAVTPDRKLVFVRQYRYLLNADCLEIPGGSSHVHEDVQEIARQELLEETGYVASEMKAIGSFGVAVGHSADRMTVFLATGCRVRGEQKLEGTELGMKVELLDIDQAYRLAESGALIDPLTVASLTLARPYLLEQ